jgi:hypothetical protein
VHLAVLMYDFPFTFVIAAEGQTPEQIWVQP